MRDLTWITDTRRGYIAYLGVLLLLVSLIGYGSVRACPYEGCDPTQSGDPFCGECGQYQDSYNFYPDEECPDQLCETWLCYAYGDDCFECWSFYSEACY
jgi:hypothetical protein